jgi:hypothetical protein
MAGEALLDDGFAWFDHDAFDQEDNDLDDFDDDDDDNDLDEDDDLDDNLDSFDDEDDSNIEDVDLDDLDDDDDLYEDANVGLFDDEDDDDIEDDVDTFNDESDLDEDLDDEDYDDDDDEFEASSGDDAKEPKWKGFFSEDNKRNIRAGLEVAHCWARKAVAEFDRIWNHKGLNRWRLRKNAWGQFRAVPLYFGSRYLTRGEIRRTRRRVRKIERILRKRRIRFVRAFEGEKTCPTEHRSGFNRYGFVRVAGGIRKIHICTHFLNQEPEEKARSIIHELVHEIGFCHYTTRGRVRCRRPGATSQSETRELARRHPAKARKNPQNYVHLFERLGREC